MGVLSEPQCTGVHCTGEQEVGCSAWKRDSPYRKLGPCGPAARSREGGERAPPAGRTEAPHPPREVQWMNQLSYSTPRQASKVLGSR